MHVVFVSTKIRECSFEDILTLVEVLQHLFNDENTVLVIEHNLDIVKVADHIIDVGPESGRSGGNIVRTGTPEDIIKKYTDVSHTAKYLKMEIDHMKKLRK